MNRCQQCATTRVASQSRQAALRERDKWEIACTSSGTLRRLAVVRHVHTREAAHPSRGVVARKIGGRIDPPLRSLLLLERRGVTTCHLLSEKVAIQMSVDLLQYPRKETDNALSRASCTGFRRDTESRLDGNRFIVLITAPGESDPGQAPHVPIGCE